MKRLFITGLYEAELGDEALLAALAHSIRSLAADDVAGQRWSRDKGYKGYTSYASLNDLPRRDPAFADLAKFLQRHAAAYAQECARDLARTPRLDSQWDNLLPSGGHPSGHIHPPSIISSRRQRTRRKPLSRRRRPPSRTIIARSSRSTRRRRRTSTRRPARNPITRATSHRRGRRRRRSPRRCRCLQDTTVGCRRRPPRLRTPQPPQTTTSR